MMYAWASPDYLLDKMTLEEVVNYYNHGIDILSGKPEGYDSEKPDRNKFINTMAIK